MYYVPCSQIDWFPASIIQAPFSVCLTCVIWHGIQMKLTLHIMMRSGVFLSMMICMSSLSTCLPSNAFLCIFFSSSSPSSWWWRCPDCLAFSNAWVPWGFLTVRVLGGMIGFYLNCWCSKVHRQRWADPEFSPFERTSGNMNCHLQCCETEDCRRC